MSDKEVKYDPDLAEKIVQMRGDGAKWHEIGNKLEIPNGKAMLYFDIATIRPKDKVKNATPEDIVRLRDADTISWGHISAMTMIPESRIRTIYTEATGKSTKGNRIGKGGRYPANFNGDRAPKAAKAKAAAKPAAAKKVKEQTPAVKEVFAKSDVEIKDHLTRRRIRVATGGGDPEDIDVKSVKAVNKEKGVISLVDFATKKARTVKIASVIAVSKGLTIKEAV